MRAQIVATFLGTEVVPSSDGSRTFYRLGILQGLRVKTFSVSADVYASIVSKNFQSNDSVIVDVEIVETRDKTFVKFVDIKAAKN